MTQQYFDQNLKIFALNSNRPLAEKIAKHVGVDLGKLSVNRFSDGEIQINIEESVRGDNVYVIQSTSAPVNDNLMELLIMVDALRRASAKTINVVMPYYGYARQDRKARSREPITAKLVANMLQNSGVDRIIALDLHAAQIQGFFDIPVDHLMGAPLLAEYFINQGVAENAVVISPDHGGVTRARALAEFLKSPIAIIDKEVVVTDSIQLPKEKQIDKIKQVSVAPLIGDAIKRINENRPVSPLFKQVFQSAQLEKK